MINVDFFGASWPSLNPSHDLPGWWEAQVYLSLVWSHTKTSPRLAFCTFPSGEASWSSRTTFPWSRHRSRSLAACHDELHQLNWCSWYRREAVDAQRALWDQQANLPFNEWFPQRAWNPAGTYIYGSDSVVKSCEVHWAHCLEAYTCMSRLLGLGIPAGRWRKSSSVWWVLCTRTLGPPVQQQVLSLRKSENTHQSANQNSWLLLCEIHNCYQLFKGNQETLHFACGGSACSPGELRLHWLNFGAQRGSTEICCSFCIFQCDLARRVSRLCMRILSSILEVSS